MRRMSSSGLGPEVAPQVTSRPPRASARMLPAQVAAPTFSITTSTPRFSVMPQTSFEKPVALWLIRTLAPIALARSSFSWLLEVTKTRAPVGAADVGGGHFRDAAVAGEEVQVVEGGGPKRDQDLTGARLRGWRLLVAEYLRAAVLVKSNRLHVASCYSFTRRWRRPAADRGSPLQAR